jgi:hypothetical protein
MAKQSFDDDNIQELRETAEAAEELAKNPEVFREAIEAFRARDVNRFQAAINQAGIVEWCHLICRFICQKHCVRICFLFCPEAPKRPIDVAEMREFAEALAKLSKDEETLRRLITIVETEDVDAWKAEIQRLKLGEFCHQLCHFLCFERCRLVCRYLCPPKPLITRIGSIPVTQTGSQGLGNGPSSPPIQVPPPSPSAGVGDHPFGASETLMGVFNMSTATQYLVEISSNPAGPFTPIQVSVTDYNLNPTPPPFLVAATRSPSGGADPGWYNVSEIPLSDGGPTPFGEKRLMDWPTTMLSDGIYYLRLRVRDASNIQRVSDPQVVQTDNTNPGPSPRPVITLQLQKPDGTRTELKCGKVKKGDGLIVVTIQAFDKNFSRLSVSAEGNSSLSVDIQDTSGVSLSKTYNGNLADQGYPTPTEFLWDPWNDPRIIPCCYIVRVDIWDRAVLNNTWSGGHGNSGWQAIEIGL